MKMLFESSHMGVHTSSAPFDSEAVQMIATPNEMQKMLVLEFTLLCTDFPMQMFWNEIDSLEIVLT